jgi:hypothetical protein
MMSGMRKIDVQDDLQAGFEVAPGPPIGPDGAPVPPAMRSFPPARPRLCEAGPCRNYHRFKIQLEAANPRARTVPVALPDTPRAQLVPGGTVYQAPAAYHEQTHHYCYPTIGIEMPLGDLPVTQCNRWNPYVDRPEAPSSASRLDNAHLAELRSAALETDYGQRGNQAAFLASRDGQRYQAEVAEWERERERELVEDLEAEQLIADSLRMAKPPTEGDDR